MASLLEMRAYIQERGTVTQKELSTKFKTPCPVIEKMMERLIEKGEISFFEVGASTCENGCCTCAPELKKHYRYNLRVVPK